MPSGYAYSDFRGSTWNLSDSTQQVMVFEWVAPMDDLLVRLTIRVLPNRLKNFLKLKNVLG